MSDPMDLNLHIDGLHHPQLREATMAADLSHVDESAVTVFTVTLQMVSGETVAYSGLEPDQVLEDAETYLAGLPPG